MRVLILEKNTQENTFIAFKFLKNYMGKKALTFRVGPEGGSYSSTGFSSTSPVFSQGGQNSSPLPIPTSPPDLLLSCFPLGLDQHLSPFYHCKLYFLFLEKRSLPISQFSSTLPLLTPWASRQLLL